MTYAPQRAEGFKQQTNNTDQSLGRTLPLTMTTRQTQILGKQISNILPKKSFDVCMKWANTFSHTQSHDIHSHMTWQGMCETELLFFFYHFNIRFQNSRGMQLYIKTSGQRDGVGVGGFQKWWQILHLKWWKPLKQRDLLQNRDLGDKPANI